jgi:hypothetical protein
LCAVLGFVCAAKGIVRPAARISGALNRSLDTRGGGTMELRGAQGVTLGLRLLQVVLLAVKQPLEVVGAELGAVGLTLACIGPILTTAQLSLPTGVMSGRPEVG